MFIFVVAGELGELLKGGNVCVNITFLHAEISQFFFRSNSFGKVRKGVIKGLLKVILMTFIVFDKSVADFSIHVLLSCVCPVFYFWSSDVTDT